MSHSSNRLLDIYNGYFETVFAETDEQRQAAFRLRYEVYCVEHPFEDPEKNPGGIETDPFDPFSLHSLLVYRPSQTVIGAVRLILPRHGSAEVRLPIHDVCDHELLAHDNPALPRAKTAEVSRFAISKSFRRRANDDATLVGGFFTQSDDARRRITNTSLGLMQAVVAMAAMGGITHLCAVLEATLLRLLRPLGIHFNPLGLPVIYHGRRQPCFSHLDVQLARIWLERPDVWELVTREGSLWALNGDIVEELRHHEFDPAQESEVA